MRKWKDDNGRACEYVWALVVFYLFGKSRTLRFTGAWYDSHDDTMTIKSYNRRTIFYSVMELYETVIKYIERPGVG